MENKEEILSDLRIIKKNLRIPKLTTATGKEISENFINRVSHQVKKLNDNTLKLAEIVEKILKSQE